ncbi:hypothetical protein LCL61_21990 [Amycolatopsis coloradensis]|uniref:Uncharacterized protein n=1 Tax=Amycolatopsis coloradensis TaxID=76021 RepID=A0ACD5BG80_9PSEU
MDRGLDATDRLWAAANLARAKGHLRDRGVRPLETLAADPTLNRPGEMGQLETAPKAIAFSSPLND